MGALLSAEWIPEHLTAGSYLSYVADSHGAAGTAVGEALSLVGLDGTRRTRIRELSLGMRQRLGIAAATMSDPRNLILDEPLNGLDPAGIQWLRELLLDFAGRGGAVLLSSHLMSELAMIVDQVVLVMDGRVARQGLLTEFVGSRTDHVYIESIHLDPVLRALADEGLHAECYRDGALVHSSDPSRVGQIAFRTDVGLSHLSRMSRTLEETYFDVVSGHEEEEDVGR